MNQTLLAQKILCLTEELTRRATTIPENEKMKLLERLTYLSGALAIIILKQGVENGH